MQSNPCSSLLLRKPKLSDNCVYDPGLTASLSQKPDCKLSLSRPLFYGAPWPTLSSELLLGPGKITMLLLPSCRWIVYTYCITLYIVYIYILYMLYIVLYIIYIIYTNLSLTLSKLCIP